MGEVLRATDTKLNRDVAIKVLPEDFGLVLMSLVAAVLSWFLKPNPAPADPAPRHVHALLHGTNGLRINWGNAFAISPDGQTLAYREKEPAMRLRVLSMGDGLPIPPSRGRKWKST